MGKKLNVLFIEDSEDDIFLLIDKLKHGGFDPVSFERVDTKESMEEALKARSWDLIVSDLVIPGFGGIAALDVLKSSGLDIPCIVVSGRAGENIAVEVMKAGACDYIMKDNLSRLAPAVERELREAEIRFGRRLAEEELRRHRDHLEELVRERTAELQTINEKLTQEIVERKAAEAALRKAAREARDEVNKSEAVTAAVGEAIAVVDGDFRIRYQNDGHLNMFGEHVGDFCYRTYYGADRACEDCPMTRSFADGRIHAIEQTLAVGNALIDVEIIASPLKDRSGDLVAGVEVVRDITARKRMEDELRQHRDHLDFMVRERTMELQKVNRELRAEIMRRIQMERDLIESRRFVQRITDATPNLLYLYDIVDKMTIYINPRVEEILGYTPDAVKRMGNLFFGSAIHPDDIAAFDASRARLAAAGEGDIVEVDYRMKNSSGEWRWFSSRDVVFKMTAKGNAKLILGIAQDITEMKRAVEELRSSREQLRLLLAHAQTVREEERARISREIHDELGQALTALKMDLSWLLKRLDKDEPPLRDKALSMTRLVDANIQMVKRIAAELRPGVLDNLGLTDALEWQAKDFEKRTGISCKIAIRPRDIRLDRNRSTAIFRIFQETLTNVARHAGASRVTASLTKDRGKVRLFVKDDGKGITAEEVASASSIGLIGMKERVGYLGGKVKISGSAGKGTSVSVSIPFYTE